MIVRDSHYRQRSQPTTYEERRAEAESNRGPSAYQPNRPSPIKIKFDVAVLPQIP